MKKPNKYIRYITNIIISDSINNTKEYEKIMDLYFIIKNLKRNNNIKLSSDLKYKLKAFNVFYKTPLK